MFSLPLWQRKFSRPPKLIAGGTADQDGILESPDQIDEDAILFGLCACRVGDSFGVHVPHIEGKRINQMVAANHLMSADVSAAPSIVAKIIVIEAVPNCGRFDVFIIIGNLPITLRFGAAEGSSDIVAFVYVRSGTWILHVLATDCDREPTMEDRE